MENVGKILREKTAVITGANRGIGRVIVEKMMAHGANVISCVRRDSNEIKEEFTQLSKKYGVDSYIVTFDLLDKESIKKGIKEIKLLHMPIDILVNNAGIGHAALVPFISIKDMEKVFQINYFAQFTIIQGLYRNIVKNSGCIINIASAAGIDGEIGNAAYGASKASLILLTKVLAKEMSDLGVRVNAVAPGLVDTELADQIGEAAKKSMIKDSLFHRLGNAEEIADLVLFMASDSARFITGQVIRIDGGLG